MTWTELQEDFFPQFSRSVVSDSLTSWTTARQASLSITNSRSPPKPMSVESVMPSNHLLLCRPLFLPSVFPSTKFFSSESALHIRWPKYWSFSFSVSPSSEYSRLISFRIDDLKASFLQRSAFFMVQLSHPYITSGKTIAFTRQTFVSKVIFLLFNTLSRSWLFFQGAIVF